MHCEAELSSACSEDAGVPNTLKKALGKAHHVSEPAASMDDPHAAAGLVVFG